MKCICGSGHDSVLHEQAVNKTRIGSLRLSRIGLRIGSDSGSDQIGSDRIGLIFSLLVQKNYFEKSCYFATCGSQ